MAIMTWIEITRVSVLNMFIGAQLCDVNESKLLPSKPRFVCPFLQVVMGFSIFNDLLVGFRISINVILLVTQEVQMTHWLVHVSTLRKVPVRERIVRVPLSHYLST